MISGRIEVDQFNKIRLMLEVKFGDDLWKDVYMSAYFHVTLTLMMMKRR